MISWIFGLNVFDVLGPVGVGRSIKACPVTHGVSNESGTQNEHEILLVLKKGDQFRHLCIHEIKLK